MTLTLHSYNSRRTEATRRKIEAFLSLPRGWHYGEGRPALPEAAAVALELVNFAASQGFTQTNVFPGVEGEVMFTIYAGDHYLEFTAGADGLVDYVREEAKEELEAEESLSVEEAKEKIAELREQLWASSGLSTSSTGTVIMANSSPSPSAGLATAASPLSTLTALSRTAAASAAILLASTLGSSEARPPSGLSPRGFSPPTATSTLPQATPETDVTGT